MGFRKRRSGNSNSAGCGMTFKHHFKSKKGAAAAAPFATNGRLCGGAADGTTHLVPVLQPPLFETVMLAGVLPHAIADLVFGAAGRLPLALGLAGVGAAEAEVA